jgi:hypothetical protein
MRLVRLSGFAAAVAVVSLASIGVRSGQTQPRQRGSFWAEITGPSTISRGDSNGEYKWTVVGHDGSGYTGRTWWWRPAGSSPTDTVHLLGKENLFIPIQADTMYNGFILRAQIVSGTDTLWPTYEVTVNSLRAKH